MQLVNNESLVERIESLKQGDIAAFEFIYKKFEPKLFTFSLRLTGSKDDAEEVVQEAFLKIWERRHLLDPQQNFDGYLFRIAKNLVYNKAKRRVYEFAFNKYLAEQESEVRNYTDDAMAYQELKQMLEDVYASLPPVRRQVFVMSRIEGLSNNEIADLLNTSTSNIENHINKALRTIKEKFKSYETVYILLLLLADFY